MEGSGVVACPFPTRTPRKRRAIRILHLDDDPVDSDRIKSTLELEGIPCEIERVVTCADFLARQKQNGHDIVISEVSAASFHGFDALEAANPGLNPRHVRTGETINLP